MGMFKNFILFVFFMHYYSFLIACALYDMLKYVVFKILGGTCERIWVHPHETTHQHVFAKVGKQCTDLDQVVAHEGFSIQNFCFQTEDGRSVALWRIRSRNEMIGDHYPVVMVHGLLDCGTSWLLHENKYVYFQIREESLPYMLAGRGYDVWVASNRGNRLSHEQHHQTDEQYWDYTLDDLVRYDMPTIINGVLTETGMQKILFVGHSQGSIQLLFTLRQHPEFANKIASFVGMGTVLSMHHLNNNLIMWALSRFHVFQLCAWLGFRRMLVVPHILSRAVGVLAYNSHIHYTLYLTFIRLLCGTTKKNNVLQDRLGVIVTHLPGGASTNNATQWIQCYRHGKMRKFDYGKTRNRVLYGSDEPPVYSLDHLKDLPFHTHLFRGSRDGLVSELDFKQLVTQFNPSKVNAHTIEDYNHLDYLWSGTAHLDVYPSIVTLFDEIKL